MSHASRTKWSSPSWASPSSTWSGTTWRSPTARCAGVARPADGPQAVRQGHRRGGVLPEAGAGEAAGLGRGRRAASTPPGTSAEGGPWSATPPALAWVVNLGCVDLNPHPVPAEDLDHPDELRIDLDPVPGITLGADRRRRPGRPRGPRGPRAGGLAEDLGLARLPHLRPDRAGSWPYPQVRLRRRDGRPRGRAARAGHGHQPVVEGGAARRLRRLQPERQGPHRRLGVLRARRLPDARVSTPLAWDEVPGCRPEAFTVPAVLDRYAERRRPVGRHRRRAPARSTRCSSWPRRWARPRRRRRAPDAARSTMPLHRDRPGQDARPRRWRARPLEGAAPRGRAATWRRPTSWSTACAGSSSLWYRIRINLQHVPEEQRPAQEPLEVDYDPWAGRTWPAAGPLLSVRVHGQTLPMDPGTPRAAVAPLRAGARRDLLRRADRAGRPRTSASTATGRGTWCSAAAPLGPVGPAVVTAAFHGFGPPRVGQGPPRGLGRRQPGAGARGQGHARRRQRCAAICAGAGIGDDH